MFSIGIEDPVILNELFKWSKKNNYLDIVNQIKHIIKQTIFNDEYYEILEDPELINELFKDYNIIDIEKFLIMSCKYGHLDILKELLKNYNFSKHNLLEEASRNGHLEIVKELLKNDNYDNYDYNNCAIMYASKNGHLEIVKELLKKSFIDPSLHNNLAIRYASENDHLEIVKELLKDFRVDPSMNDNIVIKLAQIKKHFKIVEELLKDSRVKNGYDNLNLENAIRYKFQDKFKELIKDPNLDKTSHEFQKTIYIASTSNNLEVIKELLKDPYIDPTYRNNESIVNAIDCNYFQVVSELLKDSRVNPSVPNNIIIKNICLKGNLELTKELLKDSRVNPFKYDIIDLLLSKLYHNSDSDFYSDNYLYIFKELFNNKHFSSDFITYSHLSKAIRINNLKIVKELLKHSNDYTKNYNNYNLSCIISSIISAKSLDILKEVLKYYHPYKLKLFIEILNNDDHNEFFNLLVFKEIFKHNDLNISSKELFDIHIKKYEINILNRFIFTDFINEILHDSRLILTDKDFKNKDLINKKIFKKYLSKKYFLNNFNEEIEYLIWN